MQQEGLQESARLHTFSIQDTGGTAQDRGARHRAGRVDAGRGQPRAAPAGAGQPHHGRPAVRRLRRLLAASAPTRRSARRWTGWCATAARRSCPRSPEIYGGEHLLTRRAVSQAVADKLLARLRWWEDYCARNGGQMDNNPSAGNKAGGLTTILEKSLGAVAKSGTTNLVDVVRVRRAGHRQGPGVHGHAGLRPGVGHRPGGRRREPDLLHHRPRLGLRLRAVAVAEALHQHRAVAASRRTTSTSTAARSSTARPASTRWASASSSLMLDTASGRTTKSELHGYGQSEFVPWQLGAVM